MVNQFLSLPISIERKVRFRKAVKSNRTKRRCSSQTCTSNTFLSVFLRRKSRKYSVELDQTVSKLFPSNLKTMRLTNLVSKQLNTKSATFSMTASKKHRRLSNTSMKQWVSSMIRSSHLELTSGKPRTKDKMQLEINTSIT